MSESIHAPVKRPNLTYDDPESVDLRDQGIAVGDYAAEQVLVPQSSNVASGRR